MPRMRLHWYRELMKKDSAVFEPQIRISADLCMAWMALLDLYEDTNSNQTCHLAELWVDLNSLLEGEGPKKCIADSTSYSAIASKTRHPTRIQRSVTC